LESNKVRRKDALNMRINLEVSLCSPNAKTKTFAVIPPGGISLVFEYDALRRSRQNNNAIQVSSISPL